MPNHPQRDEIFARIIASARASGGDALASFAGSVLAQCRTHAFAGDSAEDVAAQLGALYATAVAAKGGLLVEAAASSDGVLVTTCMPDQLFVVDTIRLALKQAGATRISGFNAVVRVDSSAGVVIAEVGSPESLVCFFAEGLQDTGIAADLTERLSLAQAVVADFEAMTAEVKAAAAAVAGLGEEGAEGADLLRWSLADNFVFMGVSRSNGPSLGADRVGGKLWPAWSGSASGAVSVRKHHIEAPMHRNGRVDVLSVQVGDTTWTIRGLFTRRALTQPCRSLPILRKLLDRVLAEVRHRSYQYRGLANMFDAMPTEWLFTASVEQVREVLDQVFEAEQNQTGNVHITQADGTTFALIALPERRYSEAARTRILELLTSLTRANYTDSGLFAGRFETVLLQVFQTGTRTLSADDLGRLTAFVNELATSFGDRLEAALTGAHPQDSDVLARRYAEAFPSEYGDDTALSLVATDIRLLEASRASGRTLASLNQTQDGRVLLRIYREQTLLLTDLMPIIDNFGLVISSQEAIPVQARGAGPQVIDSFHVAGVTGITQDQLLARAGLLVEGIQAVFEKKITSDAYNRLVLAAGLSWEQVDIVRGLFGYARQLSLRHPIARIQEILIKQAGIIAAAINWFDVKFNPDFTGDRAPAIDAAAETVNAGLRAIKTADEDTVIRTLANLIESMLRTNFYRTDRKFHYISFKFDHNKIRQMPSPRLWREIYVHHREVEGVHLRGGPIARGGLRFSDRADFRTEILGLVTTQMVKNVVIVPEGSKGGFYIKYTIDDAAERRRKGDELYQVLIRGLLDVTDNIVNGETVRPPRIVAHDANDPYLVVAADKGTAHLSDTANKLSLEYGFWLGDAFASGGSNGYDHKAVGITARGGWVLVRRLFREMGIDPNRDEFSAIGIGDCGGDVFGNGAIEHKKMRLVAAFNHAHIFFDPTPNAEESYVERRRLFDAVKGWDAYNTALISKGGGVFSRKDKLITLSPEVKAMLGTLQDEVTPEQAINLILKMPVDLLWNGGIGTYVRASFETNADANDPPNDDLRVAANELRCKVVGEGGNLGFTQAARVEFALLGGKLNTDFVDNSGGVDTSDHEVNLKILLNPMVASGRITMQDRNDFLRTLTDEVAQAVLDDCNANGRLISLDVVRSAQDPLSFSRAIDWICAKGNLTRRTLVLPSDEELKRRAGLGVGLTRPELAVLQAHLKMHLFKMLMQEDSSLIPGFDQLLVNYFPGAVRTRFGADIPGHMLAKAIGMTVLLTEVMTDAGCNFFPNMLDLTGSSAARVAGAWRSAMSLTGGDALKAELVAANARPEGSHRAWCAFTEGVQGLVSNWLAPGAAGKEDAGRFAEALSALAASRPSAERQAVKVQVEGLVGKGIPENLAARIVDAASSATASEVVAAATARSEAIGHAAVRYQAVGTASKLLSTIRLVGARQGGGRWDPVAMGILRLRYQLLLRELVVRDSSTDTLGLGVDKAAEALSAGNLRNVSAVIDRILGDSPDVASLLVAEQQIRSAMS